MENLRLKNLGLILVSLFFGSIGFTQSYTLVDDQTGQRFSCGNSSGITNPNCVDELSAECRSNTVYSSTTCFDRSEQECQGSPINYAQCVIHTSSSCRANTVHSSTECFENAVKTCKGSAAAISELVESVKAKALKK